MFQKYFKIIDSGELLSQIEIARKMGISSQMLNQIEQKAIALGYLKESGEDCSSSRNECSDCPAKSNCNINLRKLYLTEKGKKALLGDDQEL